MLAFFSEKQNLLPPDTSVIGLPRESESSKVSPEVQAEMPEHMREGPISPHGCAMSSPLQSPLRGCTCKTTQVKGILSHTIPAEQTCHFSHFTVSAISSYALLISPTPLYSFRLWICYVSKNCISALLERYNSSRLSQAKSELSPQEKWEDYDFYIMKVFFKKANLRELEVFSSQYFRKLIHTLTSLWLPGKINLLKAKGINKED